MLRWLGQPHAADLLMEAVENVTESGIKTQDLGGMAKTTQVTDAVCVEIEKLVKAGKRTM
jgi:isocitrate/isopropylmalate dehydrogenase